NRLQRDGDTLEPTIGDREGRQGTLHPASTPTRPARLPHWVGEAMPPPSAAKLRAMSEQWCSKGSEGNQGAAGEPNGAEDKRVATGDAAAPQPGLTEQEGADGARECAPETAMPRDAADASLGETRETSATRHLETLAAEIHDIGQQLEAFRDGAERRAAACFGAAAESCVPALARAGFADEVADVCLSLAREGREETLVLTLSPEDLHPVAAALEARDPEIGFRLEADAAVKPGCVQIDWPEGGAKIVADRMATAALELLHRRLGEQAPAERGENAAPSETAPQHDQRGETA
ncbi:MAG: hypothetical protein AAGE83_05585, partial [Pseudomonadota bacterium]